MLSFKEHLVHEATKPRSEYTLAGKHVIVKTNLGTIKFKVAQSYTNYPDPQGNVLYTHAFTQRIGGIGHIQIDDKGKVVYPKEVLSFKVV